MIENDDLPGIQNLTSEGWDFSAYFGSSIILASTAGRLSIVNYLFKITGLKILMLEADSINFALVCASENGYIDVVKSIICHTAADIDYNNYAAIRLAKKNGHIRLARYLEFTDFSDRLDEILNIPATPITNIPINPTPEILFHENYIILPPAKKQRIIV